MTDPYVSGGGGQPSPPVRVPPRVPVEDVRRSVLPGGLRVLTDEVPGAASCAVSVWVAVGSRDEPDELAGASHFLEHLLFKGTAQRDARAIAMAVDGVGGDMNAFTAAEHTAFYVRAPAEQLGTATELLLDVVEAPLLAPTDVDSEREVILEELAAAQDDPDDLAAVALFEALFTGHPLGRESLGTEESVSAISREDVAAFFGRWYRPANMVVAAAGAVDHDALVEAVQHHFGGGDPGAAPRRRAPGAVGPGSRQVRPVGSTHLALGWRAPSATSEDRHAVALLDHVFGAGPSSRLFQEIREARGLTYAVGSEVSLHEDAGALSVHSSTAPAKADQLVELVESVAAGLAAEPLGAEELARAKRAVRGGFVLGLESPVARMSRLGRSEVVRGGVTPLAEHLAALDAVTVQDVQRVAAGIFSGPRAEVRVGPA